MRFLTKMSNKIAASKNKNTEDSMIGVDSIYDIKINTLQGDPLDLKSFKGKNILFVNVASKC